MIKKKYNDKFEFCNNQKKNKKIRLMILTYICIYNFIIILQQEKGNKIVEG